MTIHHRVAQGSAEWMKLRQGCPSASNFHKIVTPVKCELSKSARSYAFKLIAEQLLNENLETLDGLQWIARGKELEPAAVRMYEFETGTATELCGLFMTDDGRIAATPDRLIVGQPGCVEIKCPAPFTHLEYMVDGFGADYIPQVQGQMLVGEFEFADRYSYFPLWPPVPCRTYRDEAYIAKLRAALEEFCDMKDDLFERIKASGVFAEPHATIHTAIDNLRDQEVIDEKYGELPLYGMSRATRNLPREYESSDEADSTLFDKPAPPEEVEMLNESDLEKPRQWFFVVTSENGEDRGYESAEEAEGAIKAALIEASSKGPQALEDVAKENAYTMNDLLPEAAVMRLKYELAQLRGSWARDENTLEMDLEPADPPQARAPANPMQLSPELGGGAPTSSESREIPMVFLHGKPRLPDYRTWFEFCFMKKLDKETDIADAAFLIGDNQRHIDAYKGTLTPPARVAAQGLIDNVLKRLGA